MRELDTIPTNERTKEVSTPKFTNEHSEYKNT